MNNFWEKNKETLIIFGILLFQFILRIVIYFNTSLFYFHDYKSYLSAVDLIEETGNIPLIRGNFLFLNSYIGYFFKYILGSIHYYFIFNSFLAVAASYIVAETANIIFNDKKVFVVSLALHSVYTEFLCWSSIFYTPVLGIFLLSLVFYSTVRLIKSDKLSADLIFGFFIILLVNFSFYIKSEMKYLYLLFIIFGLINYKYKNILMKFLLLGILLNLSSSAFRSSVLYPKLKGNVPVNDFVFFGHTLYGGDGGDGSFIYEENEKKYYRELDKYCLDNNIPDSLKYSHIVRNKFQSSEIKKFIKNHPFQWLKLQGYKFFRFFGIVPEGDSAKILITGLFYNNIYGTAVFLVFPFSIMILLILFLSDFRNILKIFNNPFYILIFFLSGYYIMGSVFYGQYQERYRMPLMVCFLIPYLGFLLSSVKSEKGFMKKKILNILIILVFIGIWSSQLYHVVVKNRVRYMKTIEETHHKTDKEN
ncbi:MAG: hypothetical protein CSB55_08600 [Candidatus Cloacimonadota bacterium]|nr:MAG: hypothetical protein CSB55_08600 [Candidatus Cloacimonadota bacterium]